MVLQKPRFPRAAGNSKVKYSTAHEAGIRALAVAADVQMRLLDRSEVCVSKFPEVNARIFG
jgi:hypothetical protein